jgi:hypothetical protein
MLEPVTSQVAPLASVFPPPPARLGAWLPVFRGRVTILQRPTAKLRGPLADLGGASSDLRGAVFHLRGGLLCLLSGIL